MTTDTEYFPVAADIANIVEDLASSYFGGAMPRVPQGVIQSADAWTSYVTISGPWNGAVTISFPKEFAVQATCNLLGFAPETVSDEDAFGVMAEVTNVISGNLKGLISASVGGTCRMSLPLLSQGTEPLSIAETREEVWFSWHGQPCCVRLVRVDDTTRKSMPPIPHQTVQ